MTCTPWWAPDLVHGLDFPTSSCEEPASALTCGVAREHAIRLPKRNVMQGEKSDGEEASWQAHAIRDMGQACDRACSARTKWHQARCAGRKPLVIEAKRGPILLDKSI